MSFDEPVTVRHVRFANESSGWAVLDAAAADGTPVALVGPLHHLEEGERARVVGEWVTDSRYGRQVKVSEAHPLAPDDPETVALYLRRIRHVGVRRAQALIERHGPAGVFDAVDADPEAAFADAGLRGTRAAQAAASWRELRVTRRLHMMLAPHGLAYLTGRIHEHHGPAAHDRIRADPYELTSIFGVGFAIADRIARLAAEETGVPLAPEQRARAAVMHVLAQAEREGSSCAPADEVLRLAAALLGDGTEVASSEIEALVRAGRIVREEEWLYRTATAELEAELAARVDALVHGRANERLSGGTRPATGRATADASGSDAGADARGAGAHAGDTEAGGSKAGGSEAGGSEAGGSEAEDPDRIPGVDLQALTEEQRGALWAALGHRLSVITGGPGTGKTSSIRTIAAAASARGGRVMLVAPTGRAAVRMSETGGLSARTVHSALGWIPGEGPTRDEQDPLPCDLLIVDETSMANLELLVVLLRAVDPEAHVVLVGDADQLAPVGAGKPFAELVAAESVPTTRLTHIFRQAADSMIVQGAHAIRRGRSPDFAPGEGMRRDLFLIERAQPRDGLAEIVSLVSERLPGHYGVDPVRDIQVFAPVYRGALGIDALNVALRAALNPHGEPVRGGRLRIGDKLMMTGRNLHELGLMNGTLLRLLDETGDGARGSGTDADGEAGGDEAALVLGAEDAVFRLAPEEAGALRLAYACSVHRGQGIELPIAIIVAHPAAGAFFLRREMLYTAVTRSRLATVIVGTREVLARAVATPDTGRRRGRVGERLAALAATG